MHSQAQNTPSTSSAHARLIVTIDGPAGTGKSSVGRALAQRHGLAFLDTGAMYRAATALAIDQGIDLLDANKVTDIVRRADLHFDWSVDPPAMLAFNAPYASRLRDEDVTRAVSACSALAPLRDELVRKQRLIGQQRPRLVTEGRDQGSIVFPDAEVKLFLDASPNVRARRRARQLTKAGEHVDVEQIERAIIERDRSDSARPVGPLVQPSDAIVVDTSDLSFDEVVAALERLVQAATTGHRAAHGNDA